MSEPHVCVPMLMGQSSIVGHSRLWSEWLGLRLANLADVSVVCCSFACNARVSFLSREASARNGRRVWELRHRVANRKNRSGVDVAACECESIVREIGASGG